MAGRHQAFVLVRDWLGESAPIDRDSGLAELARRYLAGHGPADEHDLAKWAGITIGDAVKGLRAIGSDLMQRADGLLDIARPKPADGYPPPRLLGAYEPLLLGWRSRNDFVPAHRERLIADNGLFRPFGLAGGRAVGTWSLRSGAVSISPFEPLSTEYEAALAADARDVVTFLGGTDDR
jgi:hypothetical protein